MRSASICKLRPGGFQANDMATRWLLTIGIFSGKEYAICPPPGVMFGSCWSLSCSDFGLTCGMPFPGNWNGILVARFEAIYWLWLTLSPENLLPTGFLIFD